jgi:ribulose-phosphate 3-epimerase
MISEPARYAQAFADAGAARISFHPEVVDAPAQVIDAIRTHGVGAGIAVHPDVPLSVVEPHIDRLEVVLVMTVRPGFGGQRFMSEVVPKIAAARSLVRGARAEVDVEVDGGVNLQTVDEVVGAGASIIVAGSAIYDGLNAPAAATRLRNRLDELAGAPPAEAD